MQPKKIRWSQVYESSEEELLEFLEARGIQSTRTHLDAAETLTNQQTETATTLWCAEGSLLLQAGATTISLQPGDALKIDTETFYEINAGITGCAFYISTAD